MITIRVPTPYNEILLNCNPLALIINPFRDVMLYNNNQIIYHYLCG